MVLGITGMLGAGKGTVAAYLTKNKGFVYLSVRNFLAAEVLKQGKMVNRESIAHAAYELKKSHGEEYIAKELLSQAHHEKHNVVIESVRTKAEAQYLKDHGAKVWAVDADVKVRYVRLMEGKKDADKISFEQFLEDEKKELASTNGNLDTLHETMKMADATLLNNGTKEELLAQVDAQLVQALTETIK